MPKYSSRSKHNLNLEAFAEPLSIEARYWIGFLLADGCISVNHKGHSIIGLGLKVKDIEHVRKFTRFVGVLEESVKEYTKINNKGKFTQACFDRARLAIATLYYEKCSPALDRKLILAEKCKSWKTKKEELGPNIIFMNKIWKQRRISR